MNQLSFLFDVKFSFLFSVIGLIASLWVFLRTKNVELAIGIFYFTLLEILQTIQYFYVAPELSSEKDGFCLTNNNGFGSTVLACDTYPNKILTMLTFLHICFQPLFCHSINHSLSTNCLHRAQYNTVKRLCFIGGMFLFLRYYFSFLPSWNEFDFRRGLPNEWLRGKYLCTYKENNMLHFGWSVPLADSNYFMVGISIHFFLLFGPFLAFFDQKGMLFQATMLFIFGPFLSLLFTTKVNEQASIWSFLSMPQIILMVFILRELIFVKDDSRNFTLYGEKDPIFKQLNDAEEVIKQDPTQKLEIEYYMEDFECPYFKQCDFCEERKERFFDRLDQIRALKKKSD